MIRLILVLLFLLTACGAPSGPPSAQSVVDQLKASGLEITDIAPGERPADSPLPNSYKEWLTFTIPEVAPNGGQVFVCDTKKNCDALYSYFNAFQALVGPYVFQSPNGLVVVQMNSGLPADSGAKAEQVVAAIQ
jgi:hypothetical protein